MTIGWIAACDDGVVVASDSLDLIYKADGSATYISLDLEKLRWLTPRILVFRSGRFVHDEEWLEECRISGDDPLSLTVDDVAPRVREELLARSREPDVADVEAIIAGGPCGTRSRALVLRGDGPPLELERQVAVTACMRGWAKDQGLELVSESPAPTVAAAIAFAVYEVSRCIHSIYAQTGKRRFADFFPDGMANGTPGKIPWVAFPIHIVAITPTETARFIVPEFEPDVDDEELAEIARSA